MPQRELNRLEAVHRFLKIQINKQEEFNEITQLAADICGTPSGLITLIGEDTEFVLENGNFKPNSGRDESFCHYVLESDHVMVVPDARLDSRLQDYSAVTRKAGIRFYAGAPLTTHDGHRLGSLCVIDQKPGAMTPLQQEMLENLAGQVIQLLEFESNLHFLKLQYLEAKRTELIMRSFFESTASSHLLLDRNFRVLAYNKAVTLFIRKAYGVDMKEGMDVKQFINEVYMADFMENCSRALAGESIKRERLLDFAGHSVWCMLTYDPARDADGNIIGISYNSTDITERVFRQQAVVDQQVQLDRIAYIQSHEFRRPVATIKGLIDLLSMDGYAEAYPLLKVMKKEIELIDAKIAEVVNFTDI
ncbi:GAF domain-containing protein [Mucilaginibacter sp. PAMB04168]|uniref:GAF domain-containing protein n=1 Tax=Mucilaginibacter sp. PAMB04168 TaxID=3138567 RepID=UPI0031F6A696